MKFFYLSVSLDNQCPYFDRPDYSVSFGEDRGIGAEIRFNCNEGYTLIGPDAWYCQECGEWEGFKQTTCVRTDSIPKDLPTPQPQIATTKNPVHEEINVREELSKNRGRSGPRQSTQSRLNRYYNRNLVNIR